MVVKLVAALPTVKSLGDIPVGHVAYRRNDGVFVFRGVGVGVVLTGHLRGEVWMPEGCTGEYEDIGRVEVSHER